MTDKQNTRPAGGWQEPTISVQAFADTDTKITVEKLAIGDGAWLSFKGDVTMTGVSVCMTDRETIERVRDALSAHLDGAR